MRRFLLTAFIVSSLMIGATGAAPVAHAQSPFVPNAITASSLTSPAATSPTSIMGNTSASPFGPSSQTSGASYNPINNAYDASVQKAVAAPVDPALSAAAAKTATDPATAAGNEDHQYDGVMTMIMSLFAWLVGVAALTLDYAVYYTVVTMGNYVHNLAAVGTTWRILRDLGNIALIFGFLAVGITTILNVDLYGGGKKMLPMMLAAAVFLNFSLFFSEAIIDMGNLFATEFYTQINGGTLPTADSISHMTISTEGISTKIMSQLGLQSIYNVNDGKVSKEIFNGTNPWLIGFMGIILFMITAFTMFSLAFILIARFVMLIFIIILAPIGFAGLAIPMLEKRAQQWWDSLFDQTITAPILLLLLYVSLSIITDAQFLTGFHSTPGGLLGFINNNNLAGFGGTMLSFLVAIGLLLLTATQAKRLSAFGANLATQTAGKLSLGVTAWGVNRTLGRAAYHTSRVAQQSAIFNRINAMTGRVVTGTLDRAAKGSYDIRATSAFGKFPGGGIEAGTAQKGGFVEARKQNIKEHEEAVKRIEEAQKEGFRGVPTSAEKDAITEAKEKHDAAEAAKKTADEAKKTAEKERLAAEVRKTGDSAEVARLLAESAREEGWMNDPENRARLEEAQRKHAASTADFDAAVANLTKASSELKVAAAAESEAKKAKEEAEEAPGKRLKKATAASKTAYAEGINNILNPITLLAYGPGTPTAAKKIKDALKEKPTKDKFLDAAKKMAKELEEADDKKKEEAPKPEAAH